MGACHGPTWLWELNDAGRELLAFLTINEATVCSTWFQKKDIHKRTWQHPRYKRWHCIDFVIIRQSHHRKCLDAAVMHGAECNTDHNMLKIKLVVGKQMSFCRPRTGPSVTRYNMAKLRQKSDGRNGGDEARDIFGGLLCESLHGGVQPDGRYEERSVEEQWTAMKSALCESAESALWMERKKRPDWFRESSSVLQPLVADRSKLYTNWLSSGKARDRKRIVKMRSDTRRAIRQARNAWFQSKAAEAQWGRHGGKVVWRCIRDIQLARRRYFTSILNVQSHFDEG